MFGHMHIKCLLPLTFVQHFLKKLTIHKFCRSNACYKCSCTKDCFGRYAPKQGKYFSLNPLRDLWDLRRFGNLSISEYSKIDFDIRYFIEKQIPLSAIKWITYPFQHNSNHVERSFLLYCVLEFQVTVIKDTTTCVAIDLCHVVFCKKKDENLGMADSPWHCLLSESACWHLFFVEPRTISTPSKFLVDNCNLIVVTVIISPVMWKE